MTTRKTSQEGLQVDMKQALGQGAELEQQQNRQSQESTKTSPALLQDVENLRSLINSSEDLIWFLDQDKRIILANNATLTTFKRARGSSIKTGMQMTDFLPEEQAEYFDQIFATALRGQTLRLNHRARSGVEYAATVQPVKRDNQIVGVSVFARDITQMHQLQEELRRFETIIASSPNLIALVDREYRYQMANEAYLEAFHKKREELLQQPMEALFGTEHFQSISLPYLQRAFKGEVIQFETWIELPDQGRRFLSVTYHPLRNQDITPEHVVINAHDITALQRAEDDRQRIFEVSLDMLCVLDLSGRFNEVNPAWRKTMGWPEQELKNKTWLDLVDPEDREKSAGVNERLTRGESVIGFENRCQCQDGTYKWLSWSSYPDPEKKRIFSAVRDISKRKQLENELLKLATTDPLTGASNRRHFISRASAEMERCRRYGSQLAVFMLDIDHFKQVNDSYGHDIGDEVLRRLADCCHQELRSNDIFGRFGGEEFAAILVETDQPQAEKACQRLLEKIVALKIQASQQDIGITVSMGLTMHMASDLTIDSLLKRADDALYQAKNAGRNQIAFI